MNIKENDSLPELIECFADAVLISDVLSDGRPGLYFALNRCATDVLGYTRKEIEALSPLHIDRTFLDDPAGFSTVLQELEQRGSVVYKTNLLSRDGVWTPLEISAKVSSYCGKRALFFAARSMEVREKYETTIKNLVRSTVGLTGQECLEEIVCNLRIWLAVEEAAIGIVSGEKIIIQASSDRCKIAQEITFPLTDSPFTQIAGGEFVLHQNGAGDYFKNIEMFKDTACFIGAPLLGHDSQPFGIVFAYSYSPLKQNPHIEELFSVIASRAAAECERMHYVRELSHSEDMLRTLFNSTAEAIVGLDLQGNIIFCNPSTLKILGYSQEEDLIGQCFWQMISPSLATGSQEDCPLIKAIVRGDEISGEEGLFMHKEGHNIAVEYWGHPMNHDDDLVGAVVTFIDISRRKALEEQLQHSQRMEAIGTLTGGIAHDFNNILTVISGYVGLLRSQISGDPKFLAKINKIGEAAERGSKLTHGLLAYGRKKSEPSTVIDLNQLVLQVQDIFGQVIGEQIHQKLSLCPQKMAVMADPSQIEQVLLNLATNARDAMPNGGTLTIRTDQADIDQDFCQMYGYGAPGRYALIFVQDTGVGIPKEYQQKIFDPFFTTKDTGKGTGLGLAMAWGIVKQHKGYIRVESEEGRGTCFRIYLPLSDKTFLTTPFIQDDRLPGGHETILLVEDDSDVRESIQNILTSVGYKTLSCDCADSALNVLKKHIKDFSLILSDVVMPGIKGPEFYHEIRRLGSVPVLFMSGYTFDSLREQGLVKEGLLLLNKPVKPMELLTRIREAIDQKGPNNIGPS